MDAAKRVINGTFGTVWLGGNEVGECTGLKASSKFTKEKINLCGQMEEDNKITSISNTGSITMYKVNSRMALLIGDAVSKGKDLRFTIQSKLADPDNRGMEVVVLYNVSFDDLTLADWQAAQVGKIEAPFTYGKHELRNGIKPE